MITEKLEANVNTHKSPKNVYKHVYVLKNMCLDVLKSIVQFVGVNFMYVYQKLHVNLLSINCVYILYVSWWYSYCNIKTPSTV